MDTSAYIVIEGGWVSAKIKVLPPSLPQTTNFLAFYACAKPDWQAEVDPICNLKKYGWLEKKFV